MLQHRFTQGEKLFFQNYIPGHTYKEIQKAFTEQFGWEIKLSQVKNYMGNNKIRNGLTGKFKKGHLPKNKGQNGVYFSGCEKGWFQKGNKPVNYKPVGSEQITKDGYVKVKVEDPNKWELKHHVEWEKVHGKIPKGKCIIFLNGNKTDTDINNLSMVDKKINARLNQSGLRFSDPDSTMAAVNVAILISALGEAKKKRKAG